VTRTGRRVLLAITIALMASFLAAWLANPELARGTARPAELDALGRYLAEHPADWLAASAMADRALDSELPRRYELWHAAFAHGARLAPRRPNAPAAFARAGLFHWYELGAADRARVLQMTAPLLRDPVSFERMHRPLWELTGNLAYLRANAPRTENALVMLRDIAVTNGRFQDYRELRAALVTKRMEIFNAERVTRTPADLVALIPRQPTKADEPLVRAVVEELRRRPLAAESAPLPRDRTEGLIAFAARHGIGLEGLESLLGNELSWTSPPALPGEWQGLCGRDELCRSVTATLTGPSTITLENAQSDEVPPYVEVYVDDALVAEGEIEDLRRFAVINDAGPHRVELRLANPLTRNRYQRRVRLS
jgi:hypothetical protein